MAVSFAEKLERRLKLPLPGSPAHEEMRSKSSRFPIQEREKKAAVLLVFWQEKSEPVFPLIKRTEYEGVHSGQISLPGGKTEACETPVQTALREAEEEIGVPQGLVKVLGLLSPIEIRASQFVVTPVVGYLENRPPLKPDLREVQKIISIRLTTLLHPDSVAGKEIIVSGHQVTVPHFRLEGEMVWGATAMILNELKWICQSEKN